MLGQAETLAERIERPGQRLVLGEGGQDEAPAPGMSSFRMLLAIVMSGHNAVQTINVPMGAGSLAPLIS
jgi:hypothetical protein